VHVISRKRLRDFATLHPDAARPLTAWYRVMVRMDFASFAELRRAFGSADKVGKFTVFDIAGNRYRLVAAIHFDRRRVYVRHVLTHAEYDRGNWLDD
jgi:mRNA interferase HigB